MSGDARKNLAYSTVATAPSPASSGTSLIVATGESGRFPAVPFNATIWPAGGIATPATAEIVRVTAISTDTLTITRAQEGTSARTVLVGDQIAATITAKTLTDIEGSKVSTGAAAAARPSSPAAGDLYLPNDGVYVERYSGSVWTPWGPIFPMTPPVDGDFAWINQGTASVDTTNGGICLTVPAVAASVNWKIRKKAAPATPYVITAAFLLDSLFEAGWQAALCFRQASDGKLHVFSVQRYPAAPTTSAALLLNSLIYSSPTNFSAAYSQSPYMAGSLAWLRIADNGTNRICSFSHDGQHWRVFHTVGRTTDLTATEVGFAVDNENATFLTAATLLSWKET